MEPLNERLSRILRIITEFSNTIEVISINASISASKMNTEEGHVFKVIAKEIRQISGRSTKELYDLDKLLEEFKSLSEIINIAGRQRMLAQKSMKLKFLLTLDQDNKTSINEELTKTIKLFESSHRTLINASKNNTEISQSLKQLFLEWSAYKTQLSSDKINETNILNKKLVENMNLIVDMFQALA